MSQQNQQFGKSERVNQILDLLIDGHSREDISSQLGYSTWKSLDVYMRRHGFAWDSRRRIYIQNPTTAPPSSPKLQSKALSNSVADSRASNLTDITTGEVVRLFSLGIVDAREIAKKTGFPGYKEMAAYMRRQGYIWSSQNSNYISSDPVAPTTTPDTYFNEETLLKKTNFQALSPLAGITTQENYLTLLDFLWQSRDQLVKILESQNDAQRLQVYHLQGQAKTKSIFLSEDLTELMSTLCEKHNISQKQGYEAALVEYLSKHGFSDQINGLQGLLHKIKKSPKP